MIDTPIMVASVNRGGTFLRTISREPVHNRSMPGCKIRSFPPTTVLLMLLTIVLRSLLIHHRQVNLYFLFMCFEHFLSSKNYSCSNPDAVEGTYIYLCLYKHSKG